MARGGARTNSGPPPDPDALRRDRADDKAGWTILPVDGREGPTPEWPLPPNVGLSSAFEQAQRAREVLEAQVEAGNEPRGAAKKLAQLDQVIAEVTYRLEVASDMELALWETLWHTPQAAAWEKLKWTREVALYARLQVLAELGDMDAGKEARQWSDRLGLNPAAMLRNRWKVGSVGTSSAPSGPVKKKSPASAKARMKVIQGGKGGA